MHAKNGWCWRRLSWPSSSGSPVLDQIDATVVASSACAHADLGAITWRRAAERSGWDALIWFGGWWHATMLAKLGLIKWFST